MLERRKCGSHQSKHQYLILPEKPRQEIPEQHNKNPKRIFQETSGHPKNLQIRWQRQRCPEPKFQWIQTTHERIPTKPESEGFKRTVWFIWFG